MNKRIVITLTLFSLFALWMISCSKIGLENKPNISSHGSNDSHYTGDNCMNCHYTEGPGEGWFTIAGSAYDDFQNSSARVYDASNGSLLATIDTDDLGNFYTTEEIDFSNGILIDMIKANGNVKSMNTIVYNGQCNLCHDNQFEDKINL